MFEEWWRGLGGSRRPKQVAFGLAVLFGAVAFWQCHASVSGLQWTPLFDSWRDAGEAQTILNGCYPADIVYRDTTLWYNPLTGVVVAAASWISGLPPAIAGVWIAPYANLAIPIAFTVMAWCWFDHWVALAALVFFLFGNPLQTGSIQTWSPWMYNYSTYSPWLWASHFAQAFFYFALAAYGRAVRRRSLATHLLAGLLLGMAFMTHTIPALTFGGIATLTTLGVIASTRGPRRLPRRIAVLARYLFLLATAFIVSLPYSYSILRDYRFHVVNIAPSLYSDPYYAVDALRTFVTDHLTVSNAVALAGLLLLLWQPGKRLEKGFVVCWLFIAGTFLIHSYASRSGMLQRFPFIPNQITPPHHFLVSLSGCKTILFGYGFVSLTRHAFGIISRYWARWRQMDTATDHALGRWFPVAAILVLFLALFPFYLSWKELTRTKDRAAYDADFVNHRAAYLWVLANTNEQDVFLCDQVLACQVIMPAARKLVAIMSIFANPYVGDAARPQDRDAMLAAAAAGNETAFRALERKYDVKYVLLKESQPCLLPFVREVFRSGPLAIFQISD